MAKSDELLVQQAQSGMNPLDPPSPDGQSWLSSFGTSMLGNTAEFFGVEKSPEVQRWEAQNPTSSFFSALGGYAVPFVGYDMAWKKAAKAVPKLEQSLLSLGNAEARPVATKALQEVAKYAPLEAGRIAVAMGVGDRPLGETLESAALDLGLLGGFGGGLQALKEYGSKRLKLTDLIPSADPAMPPQLQIRTAQEALNAGTVDEKIADTVKNRISEFQKAIRLEEVPRGTRYIGPLEEGDGGELNRLFSSQNGRELQKKKFIAGKSGFENLLGEDGSVLAGANDQIEQEWGKTGFGKLRDQLPFMQFPRHFAAQGESGAKVLQSTITRNLKNAGDGTWIGQEKNNGLFVVAKKTLGSEGKAGVGDSWVVFKTDRPGQFLPQNEAWAGRMADKLSWLSGSEESVAPTGAKLYDFAQGMEKKFPMQNYLSLKEPISALAKGVGSLSKVANLDKVMGGAGQAFDEFVKRYFVPTAHQFGGSPRANWINGMARAIYEEGDRLTHSMMYGEGKLQGKNLFASAVKGTVLDDAGSIKAALDKLNDKDLLDVWKAWNSQAGEAQVKRLFADGELSGNAKDFLTLMRENDRSMIQQIQETQKAYGQKLFQPLENHYMVSRTWDGDWRVPIYNEADQLVYMASGKTKNQAEQNAKRIVSKVDKGWTAKEAVTKGGLGENPMFFSPHLEEMALSRPEYYEAAKVQEELLRATRKPGFMEHRQGVGGYAGEKAPWSKEELERNILGHISNQNKYLAKLIVNERFAPDLYKLAAEDPSQFTILQDRLNDLEGKQGPLAKIQNQVVDKVLSPVLGTNSATKIVSATNKLFYTFNLGAMQLAQPVMNLLTFTQTVLPELAFVLNATPSRVARYYTVWPRAGKDGVVEGAVHVLDPLKIFKQSLGEMANPSEELKRAFEKAAGDGVISPRLYEEYIGQNARKVGDLKGALSSPGGFASWLDSLGNIAMTGTEKLSRGNSFVNGYILGRDFLQLDGDALYAFAKKFTQRTMYGYATADRSRIFTTPIGSALGLFKNWMMHYIGSMLEYTGEGLQRGNWSPLLWQVAGTGAVGGLAATGPAYLLADSFSKFATNKSAMDQLYELTGGGSRDNLLRGSLEPNLSDALFLGLPTLLGVSLSSSGAAPFANPTRDITQLMSFVHLDRMAAAGKALGTAVDTMGVTGQNPFADATVRDQMARAFMPKTLYRTIAVWEDKALRSLRDGSPQYKDLSMGERLAYASGLNPTNVERGFRLQDELWQEKKKMDSFVQSAGQAFYNAQQVGDKPTMNSIMLHAMAQGVDFSRVLKVVSTHWEKDQKTQMERIFSPTELLKKKMLTGQ